LLAKFASIFPPVFIGVQTPVDVLVEVVFEVVEVLGATLIPPQFTTLDTTCHLLFSVQESPFAFV
jgi:hypothetical protein